MRYTDAQIRDLIVHAKEAPSEDLEDETIEFKGYRTELSLHNAKDLPEEISVLANRSGGLILIGVQDSSNVQHGEWEAQLVGVDETDNVAIRERLTGKVQPFIEIRVRSIEFDGHYVAIGVPHRSDTLVSTRSGKVYIRDGRSSRSDVSP
jgi:ATP-dependent DNA helicase RecG